MNKIICVLFFTVLSAEFSFAKGAYWSVMTEKRTGKNIALLQTDSNREIKRIPLEGERGYIPASYDAIKNKKQRALATSRGDKYFCFSAKDISATPIEAGRLLVLQEQTIVMPPELGPRGGALELKKKARRVPDENYIMVTLFDDAGNTLWSRKFGPLAGRFSADPDAWAPADVSEMDPAVPVPAKNRSNSSPRIRHAK